MAAFGAFNRSSPNLNRHLIRHLYLAMLYLHVAIQAVNLLLADMFVMDQIDIGILLFSVHMAEIAFFPGRDAVAFRDFHVALVAFVPGL